MFNFFQQTTIESIKSIYSNKFLIKSLNFEKEALILSIIFRNSFSQLIESLILFLMLIYFHIPFYFIFGYIFTFLLLVVFTYGVSLFLSSLAVFVTDVDNVWNFVSRLIWIGTPIFYQIEGQTRLLKLNLLNPLYYSITFARDILLFSSINPNILLGVLASSLTSLLVGQLIFNKLKNSFAEKIWKKE